MKRFIAIICVLAVALGVLACFVGCNAEVAAKTSQDGNWTYYELEDNKACLASYIGASADVVVPATIDGRVVSAVQEGLFVRINDGSVKRRLRGVYENNELIRTITFVAAITDIPARTFYMCSNLTDITLPAVCKTIGDFAFYGCRSLQTITLPAACESVGAYCFRECENLREVNILNPELMKIGDKCFYMVNQKESNDDQYYIIKDLVIRPINPTVYDSNEIELARRRDKNNYYRYWIDYIDNGNVVGGVKTGKE